MNNQAISMAANAVKQSPFDEARNLLSREQVMSEDLVGNLYNRLDRALDPVPSAIGDECVPCPPRAEICRSIDSAISAQRSLNAQLQDILSRLAI